MTVARAFFAERPARNWCAWTSLKSSARRFQRRSTTSAWLCSASSPSCWTRRSPSTIRRRLYFGCCSPCWTRPRWSSPGCPYLLLALDDAPHGLLPDMAHCTACGEALHAAEITFNSLADGLFCAVHRNGSASPLSADCWQLAQRMLRAPVSAFAAEPWPRAVDRTCAASRCRPLNATWNAGCAPPRRSVELAAEYACTRSHADGVESGYAEPPANDAIIEREDDGFVALCPELDIASQGSTIEEARVNLVEALTLFFEAASTSEVRSGCTARFRHAG